MVQWPRLAQPPMKTITAYTVASIGKKTKDLDPMIKVGLFPEGPFDFTVQKGTVDILLGSNNIEFHPIIWDERAGLILSRSRLDRCRMMIAGKVDKSCLWLSCGPGPVLKPVPEPEPAPPQGEEAEAQV